jgi:hypothetical protein
MKTCIVTYAKDGRERYSQGVPRMVDSAVTYGYAGDFILCVPGDPDTIRGLKNERDLPVPGHVQTPYGFKPWLVAEALNRGYSRVLWVDSTIVFTASTDRLFGLMDEVPVLLFDNPGCPIPHWTNDATMEAFGWDPKDLRFEVMACVLGFNFENEQAMVLFRQWNMAAINGLYSPGKGSTRPDYRDHRHDQSVISILGHQMGFPFIPYGTLTYWNDRNANTLISNRGIGQP